MADHGQHAAQGHDHGSYGSYGTPPAPPPAPAPGPAVGAPRPVRVRQHILPALAILALIAAVTLVAFIVFALVFLVDDSAEDPFDVGEALGALVSLGGLAVGVTLVSLVVGLVLDRLTVGAPMLVRAAAPLPLPLAGIAMVLVGADVGYYLVELGVVLCLYWGVFLVQNAAVRVVRGLWNRMSAGRAQGPG